MKCEAKTEQEMRDAVVPSPEFEQDLIQYIDSLLERQHDYGTCVYAMSMAATAAFNYVAGRLGVTGFQASCADLDVVRRTRRIKGPFMLIDAEKGLYPQYDLQRNLSEAMAEWAPWFKEQAAKKLLESPNAHPEVVAYWKRLAEQ